MDAHQGGAPGSWGIRPLGVWLVATLVAACLLASTMTAPATAGAPAARAASAKDLRGLVNQERAERGLRPVRAQAQLATAARGHASDMVRRGYASHVSPTGSTLRSRVRDTGYLDGARHWVLGEAIAWAAAPKASASQIVAALMASPKHKAVLLDPAVTELGIGIAEGLPRAADTDAVTGITVTLDFGRVTRR